MNHYELLRAIQAPKAGGRTLLTSYQGDLGDRFLNELQARSGASLYVIQDTLRGAPSNLRICPTEGQFPEDIEGSRAQFSLILSPTPRDQDGHSETPTHFSNRLQACLAYLAPGGFLYLCAEGTLMHTCIQAWAGRLLQVLDHCRLLYIPEGERLLLGFKRSDTSPAALPPLRNFLADLRDGVTPPLDLERIQLPDPAPASTALFFRSRRLDPGQLAERASNLPWDSARLACDLLGSSRPPVFPAMALRARLYGALMASGVLGSMRLTSPLSGHQCIVRGDTHRSLHELAEDAHKAGTAYSPYRLGAFAARISVLDLHTGCLVHYDPQHAPEIRQFLEEWSEPLAGQLQSAFPTAYDPLAHPYPEVLKPVLLPVLERAFTPQRSASLNPGGRPGLTPSQRHVLCALLIKALGRRALLPSAPQYPLLSAKGNKSVVLAGDPGTGKTYISIRFLEGLTREYAQRKGCSIQAGGWPLSLVVTPPANLPNYLRSFQTASPFFTVRVVERVSELHACLREASISPVPVVLLIARTRLRQSQALRPVYQTSDPPYSVNAEGLVPNIHCPTCKTPIPLPRAATCEAEIEDLIASSLIRGAPLRGAHCSLCGEPLWQEADNGGLYSLARALRVWSKKLKLALLGLVLDEVHEDGAETSRQGQVMAWLVDLFPKVLALSGTFYGGTASANFHLFFRLFPWFRRDWGINGRSAFISRYGSWRQDRHSRGWGARKELPGVSAELISNYLINDLVYLSLSEAGFAMVERRDIPLLVAPDSAEQLALQRLHSRVKADLVVDAEPGQRLVSVNSSQLARLQVFPNGMHLDEFAQLSPAFRFGQAQHPDPSWRSCKEKALLGLVRREAVEGRPCLVYVYHSGRYALDERLHRILAADGIASLNAAAIPGQDLEREINLAAATGTQAVIVNPRRAGVGLNLVGTPTIIFYQPLWSVLLTLQGAARAHRPTQKQSVRVFYMVLQGSVEEVILGRVAERMAAIFLASGGDHEGMAAIFDAVGREQSLTELLVSYVSNRVSCDLASVFAQLNQAQSTFAPMSASSAEGMGFPPFPRPLHVDFNAQSASQICLFPA